MGLQKCHPEDLTDLGALPRVASEHSTDEHLEVLGIGAGEILKLSVPDPGFDLAEDVPRTATGAVGERGFEGTKAVEDAPKRPDVRLRVIGAALPDFGRHVVWSADLCRREAAGAEDPGDAKVTELDGTVFHQEDVGRLQIPMQDSLLVQIGKRHRNLAEYGQYLRLRELFAVRRELGIEIAGISMFHDNEEVPCVLEALNVSDDVRVVECCEESGFGKRRFRQ
jgi:hypothetical protein